MRFLTAVFLTLLTSTTLAAEPAKYARNGERFDPEGLVFDAETERSRQWQTLEQWFEVAAKSRAESTRAGARGALKLISKRHATGDQLLTDDEQAAFRAAAVKLLVGNDLAAHNDIAEMLRPFADESCRKPLLAVLKLSLKQSQSVYPVPEALDTLSRVADDSCIPVLTTVANKDSIVNEKAVRVIAKINSTASRNALESLAKSGEYEGARETAREELDRLDAQAKEKK